MTRGYMKDDIRYSIVLLSRVMGLPVVGHLNIWMVHFIETIQTTKMPIDWVTILSANLDEQLVGVKADPKFYMISYLVYLLVARKTNYTRLFKRGSMQDANAWPYVVYPQLVKKKLLDQNKEYQIMNYAFIFAIIQVIEGDYAKRMLVEAVARIAKISAYYIQFKIFTYLRVVGTTVNLKKLPRYPSDTIILLEIERQLTSAYNRVRKHHKKTWVWPITIAHFEVK